MPAGTENLKDIALEGAKTDLPGNTGKDPHYDPDIASEIKRMQAMFNPIGSESRMNAVTRHFSMFFVSFRLPLLTRHSRHNSTARYKRKCPGVLSRRFDYALYPSSAS